jgi:hypothetical protein
MVSYLLAAGQRNSMVVAFALLGACACNIQQNPPHPHFEDGNWVTVETLGCFAVVEEPRPIAAATHPPHAFRLDVQRNLVTAALDSVIGTTGIPDFYESLPSAWWADGEHLVLHWTNFHGGLTMTGRLSPDGFEGRAEPTADIGGPSESYPVFALRVDCAPIGEVWHYVSTRGGRRMG